MALFLAVRIPKSGSSSLGTLLDAAFADRHIFRLPSSLDLDGEVSAFQRLRFWRSRTRNLIGKFGTLSYGTACARIAACAADGDLISGGHLDYLSIAGALARPLKIVSLLRDPYHRARSEYNYARRAYQRRGPLGRLDSGLLPKMAARYSFEGFLDFQIAHGEAYGNIAARFLGWVGGADLKKHLEAHVFHCGVLEQPERYCAELSEKLGKRVVLARERATQDPVVEEIASGARARIEKLYARDFELYARFASPL